MIQQYLCRPLILLAFLLPAIALSACGAETEEAGFNPPLYPNETPELRQSINYWSDYYEVPPALVHRLAIRESTHRPAAVNRPYYGLLQILPATARSMGFNGAPKDLLDADTNLEFSVKYLRGAWLLSDGDFDTAVKHYSRGYYYAAKRRGMLKETGLAN
ncbi:lytic transglycosylase domain-containing protein [Pseudophaeobacter flagellatus]|uniref:lytic transglycosylase domain-containing protein n=1 Tax=Pseudophaeobacter flagellatus TaxID=2899119 RepID=UPI001E2FD201|nr:lytic transglycosylase domain-containing protein [Pseudophaeobacter flagellatus]MCD9147668.1 lytic transglycosylase domain-containing protein [Pseudophaeobacter flagellatus]